VPYAVDLSLDARQPSEFVSVKPLTDGTCQSFDWYLAEIYPGLEQDRPAVEVTHRTAVTPCLVTWEVI